MLLILFHMFAFTALDVVISSVLKPAGTYYISHCIHNCIVIYDVIMPPYDTVPALSMDMVVGFHLYHIVWYLSKLRIIDWAHHILMVSILLLIYGEQVDGVPIRLGLFFTTGLPGLCDYTVLSLERNHVIANSSYRTLSKHINVWIRGPGCIIAAYEVARFAALQMNDRAPYEQNAVYVFAAFVFWNGAYFAMKAVEAANGI